MNAPLRALLYAAGALAGVYFIDRIRPVSVDAAAGAAAGGFDLGDFAGDLLRGDFGGVGDNLKGAGSRAAGAVRSQIRSNVITGVVGGCVAAGVVDWLVS